MFAVKSWNEITHVICHPLQDLASVAPDTQHLPWRVCGYETAFAKLHCQRSRKHSTAFTVGDRIGIRLLVDFSALSEAETIRRQTAKPPSGGGGRPV